MENSLFARGHIVPIDGEGCRATGHRVGVLVCRCFVGLCLRNSIYSLIDSGGRLPFYGERRAGRESQHGEREQQGCEQLSL